MNIPDYLRERQLQRRIDMPTRTVLTPAGWILVIVVIGLLGYVEVIWK
jgi:hypothetical protein